MADKLKYTAKIRSKGLDNTGVTEDWAQRMAGHLNGHTLLIVEVEHADKTVKGDGDEQVNLIIKSAEPVPAEQENTVREFVRAIARMRRTADGQLEIPDGELPAADAVQAAAGALEGATANANEAWDGDPDAPVPAATEDGICPSPWCEQPEGHDGDHDPEKSTENVVKFSGKG